MNFKIRDTKIDFITQHLYLTTVYVCSVMLHNKILILSDGCHYSNPCRHLYTLMKNDESQYLSVVQQQIERSILAIYENTVELHLIINIPLRRFVFTWYYNKVTLWWLNSVIRTFMVQTIIGKCAENISHISSTIHITLPSHSMMLIYC